MVNYNKLCKVLIVLEINKSKLRKLVDMIAKALVSFEKTK